MLGLHYLSSWCRLPADQRHQANALTAAAIPAMATETQGSRLKRIRDQRGSYRTSVTEARALVHNAATMAAGKGSDEGAGARPWECRRGDVIGTNLLASSG